MRDGRGQEGVGCGSPEKISHSPLQWELSHRSPVAGLETRSRRVVQLLVYSSECRHPGTTVSLSVEGLYRAPGVRLGLDTGAGLELQRNVIDPGSSAARKFEPHYYGLCRQCQRAAPGDFRVGSARSPYAEAVCGAGREGERAAAFHAVPDEVLAPLVELAPGAEDVFISTGL